MRREKANRSEFRARKELMSQRTEGERDREREKEREE